MPLGPDGISLATERKGFKIIIVLSVVFGTNIFMGGASAERRCRGENLDYPRASCFVSAVRQRGGFTQTRHSHMLTVFNQNLEKHCRTQIKNLVHIRKYTPSSQRMTE